MNALGFFLICLAAFVVVVTIARLFNHLVLVKHNVERAWADISVLLKQRQDELGKLIVVCREYARHEGDLLERITRSRTLVDKELLHADVAGLNVAERGLRTDLGDLLAFGEANPTLKADEGFRHLSTRISELEAAIADRRSFYNATVEINNNTIESFPEVMLAGPFGFRAAHFLGLDGKRRR